MYSSSLNIPVKREITIGTHKQKVIYKGDGILGLICGKLGHTSALCGSQHQEKEAKEDVRATAAQVEQKEKWELFNS